MIDAKTSYHAAIHNIVAWTLALSLAVLISAAGAAFILMVEG